MILARTQDGEEIYLTPDESKFVRAVLRLEKINRGRILLFGSGRLDIRVEKDDGTFAGQDRIIYGTNIRCDGGDGGDYI